MYTAAHLVRSVGDISALWHRSKLRLLLLLWVKRGLLSLHLLDKFLDAIEGLLVREHARNVLVALDLSVELDAFVAL